ncbi:MAG: RNA polymerase sigma-70 factor (ECF subfamily) [Planctomycetota bacterium]|jgi:RNA polymerase sigma-70 factor (ECF subfamily)
MEVPPDMTRKNDATPLQLHRAGDPSAFAELVERHQSALLRLARMLLGRGQAHDDVVQEAFLRLAQKPPLFDDGIDPKAERARLASWLYTVTRNICMDVLRAETRRKSRERAAAAEEACEGGLRAVDAADTRALVEARLMALPVDQREVLVLRLLLEKSYREIAEITGKTIGTVGWIVSVGLKALSSDLEPLLAGAAGQSTGIKRTERNGQAQGGTL